MKLVNSRGCWLSCNACHNAGGDDQRQPASHRTLACLGGGLYCASTCADLDAYATYAYAAYAYATYAYVTYAYATYAYVKLALGGTQRRYLC